MNVALLGFGVVGRGVYDLTLDRSDINIKYVVCLEDVTLPGVTVTRDYQQILNDETVDTVVEAMGGLHPAWDFVKAAIEAGKNVVTSNKAMAATFYDELLPLVQEKKVLFRCTAAVGGGIVGTGTILATEEEGVSEIVAAFLAPEAIGRGLGRKLFAALESDPLFTGAKRVWLTSSITALKFYEKIGYTYEGGYFHRNEEGLIVFEKFPAKA